MLRFELLKVILLAALLCTTEKILIAQEAVSETKGLVMAYFAQAEAMTVVDVIVRDNRTKAAHESELKNADFSNQSIVDIRLTADYEKHELRYVKRTKRSRVDLRNSTESVSYKTVACCYTKDVGMVRRFENKSEAVKYSESTFEEFLNKNGIQCYNAAGMGGPISITPNNTVAEQLHAGGHSFDKATVIPKSDGILQLLIEVNDRPPKRSARLLFDERNLRPVRLTSEFFTSEETQFIDCVTEYETVNGFSCPKSATIKSLLRVPLEDQSKAVLVDGRGTADYRWLHVNDPLQNFIDPEKLMQDEQAAINYLKGD